MRGQVSTPFHWIYVLVAGAIILLFFIGLVAQQRETSEKELSVTVSRKLDGIFTGASLSEQTVNVVDVPELKFSFSCDKDDASTYTVGDGSPQPIAFQPFFASDVVTTKLITWTLEFNMPYKIINLLFIGSPDIATYVVYDDFNRHVMEDIMSTVPAQFGFRQVHVNDFPAVEGDFVKLIFVTNAMLPAALPELPDEHVRVVQISPGTATYYTKSGARLEKEDDVVVLSSFDRKNPAFYAALFSDSAESYRCGMRKAFKRMSILADIYNERAKEIMLNYPSNHECRLRYQASQGMFSTLKQAISSCSSSDTCFVNILSSASDMRDKNTELQENQCAALY